MRYPIIVVGDTNIETELTPYLETGFNHDAQLDYYVIGGCWSDLFTIQDGKYQFTGHMARRKNIANWEKVVDTVKAYVKNGIWSITPPKMAQNELLTIVDCHT